MRVLSLYVTCFSVAVAWAVCGQIVLAADADEPLTIPLAIEQLGNNDFEARERAAAFLWAAGDDALPQLEEAAFHTDSVVRSQATAVLERVRYGILPTTPPEVAEQLHTYRTGDKPARYEAVQQLLALEDYRSIARLIQIENDDELREKLLTLVSRHPLAPFVIDRKDALVEAVLEARGEDSNDVESLAVYATVRGRLPECIARVRQAAGEEPKPFQLRQLVALERAAGNLPAARMAVEKLDDPHALLKILIEEREWARATATYRDVKQDWGDDEEFHSHLAAYFQRAGLKAEFRDAVESLRRVPLNPDLHDNILGHQLCIAQGLLALEQFDDAMKILAAIEPGEVVSLYAGRGDYAAALALAKCDESTTFDEVWFQSLPVAELKTDDEKFASRQSFALATMPVLSHVGRRSDAHAVLQLLMAQPAPVEYRAHHHAYLAEAAIRGGFVTEARALACRSLADDDENYQVIWGHLFSGHSDIPREWYAVLQSREPALETPEAVAIVWRLIRLDATIAVPAEELADLVEEASKGLDASAPNARRRRIAMIVDTCLMHGRPGVAREALEKAVVPHDEYLLLRLGDLAREEGDKATAREWYAKAWRCAPSPAMGGEWKQREETDEEYAAKRARNARHRDGVLALYLLGVVTDGAEGKKHKETALLLSLNPKKMHAVASALADRGLTDEAKPIWELILRTMSLYEWEFSNAAQRLGNAISDSDPIRASWLWDSLLLSVLPVSGGFTEVTGYLEIPFMIHKVRGRGLLHAGKIDEAWREFAACQKILPGDPGLIEAMVPRLEAAGAQEKADELFRFGYERARALSDAWPKAAGLHNNAAWIAACCHRELDDALVRATKAVELEPMNAAYLDTLAEVHFQRGDRAAAIEQSGRAVGLAPHDKTLPVRLTRFKTAPLPEGNDASQPGG